METNDMDDEERCEALFYVAAAVVLAIFGAVVAGLVFGSDLTEAILAVSTPSNTEGK